MKNNILKKIIVTTLAFGSLLTFAACGKKKTTTKKVTTTAKATTKKDSTTKTKITTSKNTTKKNTTTTKVTIPTPKARIIFDTKGGSSMDDLEVAIGGNIVLPTEVPTYAGMTFVCWCADQDCNTPFTQTVMPNSNITVYAKWKETKTSPKGTIYSFIAGYEVNLNFDTQEKINGFIENVMELDPLTDGAAYAAMTREEFEGVIKTQMTDPEAGQWYSFEFGEPEFSLEEGWINKFRDWDDSSIEDISDLDTEESWWYSYTIDLNKNVTISVLNSAPKDIELEYLEFGGYLSDDYEWFTLILIPDCVTISYKAAN